MIPQQVLSTTPVPAPYLPPDDQPWQALISLEYGGVALRDASQGLLVKVWTFQLYGADVRLSAPGVLTTTLFTQPGITWLSGCFDQNMNPCVAYMVGSQMTLWWYDTTVEEQVFTDFDGEQPHVCMDDKRPTQNAANDIILAYVLDGTLCFRAQRDRFEVEYELGPAPESHLFTKLGMNSGNRLQFEFTPVGTP